MTQRKNNSRKNELTIGRYAIGTSYNTGKKLKKKKHKNHWRLCIKSQNTQRTCPKAQQAMRKAKSEKVNR